MAKTNGEHTETCGRCGHPKTDHVAVSQDFLSALAANAPLICPTALFLKDELQGLMDTEKAS